VGEDLSDIGEFELVRRLLGRVPTQGLVLGAGDDAAVLHVAGDVIATTDLLVEGRHFDFAFSSPADIGHKALCANASDVAAMGGRPRHALIGIGCPPSTSVGTVEGIYDGIGEAARAFDIVIAGGDTVGADQLIVSIAMLGDVGEAGAVSRAGARASDVVCVTGELGAAAAGLWLLRAASTDPEARALIERFPELVAAHRRGRARVPEGQAAAAAGACAMIDVSDGLLADVGHICERSGVGVLIDGHAVPIAAGVRDVEAWAGREGIALAGGDDYELAFTIDPDAVDHLTRAIAPTELTVIGRVVEGSTVEVSGAILPDTAGWDSFR